MIEIVRNTVVKQRSVTSLICYNEVNRKYYICDGNKKPLTEGEFSVKKLIEENAKVWY